MPSSVPAPSPTPAVAPGGPAPGASWLDNSGTPVPLAAVHERRTARLAEPTWLLEQARRQRSADFVRPGPPAGLDRFNCRMARRCNGAAVAGPRQTPTEEGNAPCFTGLHTFDKYERRRALLKEAPDSVRTRGRVLRPADFHQSTERYLVRMMRFNE